MLFFLKHNEHKRENIFLLSNQDISFILVMKYGQDFVLSVLNSLHFPLFWLLHRDSMSLYNSRSSSPPQNKKQKGFNKISCRTGKVLCRDNAFIRLCQACI